MTPPYGRGGGAVLIHVLDPVPNQRCRGWCCLVAVANRCCCGRGFSLARVLIGFPCFLMEDGGGSPRNNATLPYGTDALRQT